MTSLVQLPPASSPSIWGLPAKFSEWRGAQYDAILKFIDSPRRFIAQAAPTGFGKSLMYVAAAQMTGARVAILTSTKALQSQLSADFAEIGLKDIRGLNAYQCKAATTFGLAETTGCDRGPCHTGTRCNYRDGGCFYYDAEKEAQNAKLLVTNYAYWMHNKPDTKSSLTASFPFDLLVLDEAHDAPDALASHLSVEIQSKVVLSLLGKGLMEPGADIEQWKEWGVYMRKRAEERYDDLTANIKGYERPPTNLVHEAHEIRGLMYSLETVAGMKGEWVAEPVAGGMKFDAVWPNYYAERFLFKGIPKVMLVSATVRPKTAQLLGIGEEQLEFNEYPSTFPVDRRPVLHVPTVQMNRHTDDSRLRLWLNRIDQIIDARLDRKGIIHTVSYERAKLILANSRHSGIMLSHTSRDTRTVSERFKRAAAPTILVSPVMTTGWDFPYEQCEYQIIGKLPFPDNRAKVIKARMESDKEYSNYMTMQVLVQACGRGMRAEDDRCETLIIDDSVGWFLNKNRQFAPQWWLDSFRRVSTIPKPLPKL